MASDFVPMWPTFFGVATVLVAFCETGFIRKGSDRASASRLFLLIAASLFAFAGFADVLARFVVVGRIGAP